MPAFETPFWSSLSARYAHIVQGGALARRYPAATSSIAGLPGAGPANVAALQALVAVGDDAGIVGPRVPMLLDNWETPYESRATQITRADQTLLPEGDAEALTLTADVAEMLALVALAKLAPLRPRTIELGTYIGIREGGRLVAMAGERSWVGDYREVSTVCTRPDVQGRYTRALIGRVVSRMLRLGQMPYLRVEAINTWLITPHSR